MNASQSNTSSQVSSIAHSVFLCNKPTGSSSNRVLQQVKRSLGLKKAGHTGSLDPLATGVLPLCFGEATKFAQYGLDAVKCYRVRAKLGVVTETGDSDGQHQTLIPRPQDITEQQVRTVISSFLGIQQQQAHPYSALKFQGRPLYEYAREGIEVPVPSREICISQIKIELIDLEQEILQLWVCCSKGTYIRSLIQHIGEALSWGAHVTALHRTHAGAFNDQTCEKLEVHTQLDEKGYEKVVRPTTGFVPISSLLLDLPWRLLIGPEVARLKNGHAVQADAVTDISALKEHMVHFYNSQGCFFENQQDDPLMTKFLNQGKKEPNLENSISTDIKPVFALYTLKKGSLPEQLWASLNDINADISQYLVLRGIVEHRGEMLQPCRMVAQNLNIF